MDYSDLGSQGTVAGGGRYDYLVERLVENQRQHVVLRLALRELFYCLRIQILKMTFTQIFIL